MSNFRLYFLSKATTMFVVILPDFLQSSICCGKNIKSNWNLYVASCMQHKLDNPAAI